MPSRCWPARTHWSRVSPGLASSIRIVHSGSGGRVAAASVRGTLMSRRTDRLNEQVKREIAEILQTRVKDPRVGSVVVTGARVAADLSLAQIYVVITGEPDEQKATLEGLEAAAPFVRSELGQRLSVRKLPQLRFVRDESFDYANRIEQLLHEIRPPADSPAKESGKADDE